MIADITDTRRRNVLPQGEVSLSPCRYICRLSSEQRACLCCSSRSCTQPLRPPYKCLTAWKLLMRVLQCTKTPGPAYFAQQQIYKSKDCTRTDVRHNCKLLSDTLIFLDIKLPIAVGTSGTKHPSCTCLCVPADVLKGLEICSCALSTFTAGLTFARLECIICCACSLCSQLVATSDSPVLPSDVFHRFAEL